MRATSLSRSAVSETNDYETAERAVLLGRLCFLPAYLFPRLTINVSFEGRKKHYRYRIIFTIDILQPPSLGSAETASKLVIKNSHSDIVSLVNRESLKKNCSVSNYCLPVDARCDKIKATQTLPVVSIKR